MKDYTFNEFKCTLEVVIGEARFLEYALAKHKI